MNDEDESSSDRNETAEEADEHLCAIVSPLEAETDYQLKISTTSSNATWSETADDTVRFKTPPNR